MRVTDEELRRALLRGGSAAERTECPSSEALARAATAAPEGAGEAIVEHLARCAECTQEFLLAASLKPWAEEAAAQLTPPLPAAAIARARPRPLWVALAASLAAVVALGGWTGWLRRQNAALEEQLSRAQQDLRGQAEAAARPRTGVRLVDLFPRDPARGAVAKAAELQAPPAATLVVFILNVRRPGGFYNYAELCDAPGHPLWGGALAAGAEPLTLAVPGSLLVEGSYSIRLYRRHGSQIEAFEDYAIQVGPTQGPARR